MIDYKVKIKECEELIEKLYKQQEIDLRRLCDSEEEYKEELQRWQSERKQTKELLETMSRQERKRYFYDQAWKNLKETRDLRQEILEIDNPDRKPVMVNYLNQLEQECNQKEFSLNLIKDFFYENYKLN
jgi:hypothetical protein